MTEVIMPKMGDGMEEGTLLEWLKKDGESVKSGDVIGTIQTDKATLELEAPGRGKLAGILIKPGDTVPVGQPIALLLKDGESVPLGWGTASNDSALPEAQVQKSENSAPASGGEVHTELIASMPAEPVAEGRIKASPLARKIAEELGITLAAVTGTGPNGRITEKDVRDAAGNDTRRSIAPSKSGATGVPSVGDTKVPLNRLRQIIAERTSHSKQTVPHFYVTVEVDLENVLDLRSMFEREESGKVSINDFVVRACVLALQDMPEVNATYHGDHVIRHGAINIGIAAAVDDGLLVPVIHNAHALSLRNISVAAKDLVIKARDGKLLPNEMTGSTFSISNMGMLNVDVFEAIINEPNCAILAISSARKKVVVAGEDEIEIRTRMNITASFDHRVIDGAVGAKFVNVVREYIENPTRLLS